MIEAIVAAALGAVVVSFIASAVLYAIVAIVVRAVPIDATLRHALWTVALGATAIMPLGAFALAATRAADLPWPVAPAMAGSSMAASRSLTPPVKSVTAPALTPGAAIPDRPLVAFVTWRPHLNATAARTLGALWIAGTGAGFIGLALSIRRVAGLKRRSSPLDAHLAAELPWLTETGAHEREIYLRLSYESETPLAVGFRRPVILIPTELATQDGLGAIEGLVLHEHAHLRRYDDWTNLLGRCVERLFWFNPLVWALGRRIALEREIAADDAVVEALGRPHEYAQSLWRLAREMRMPEHAVVAPGALFTRKQISIRIEALLERRAVAVQWRPVAAGVVGLTAIGCTVAAAATAPVIPFPRAAVPIAATTPAAKQNPEFEAAHARASAQIANARSAAKTAADANVAAHANIGAAATHPAATVVHAVAADRSAVVVVSRTAAGTGERRITSHPTGATGAAGEDLSASDLRDVDWRGRTFTGTDLAGADLRGARLDNARFIGADLSGARLDGASLTNAVMEGALIDGASFRGAHTTGLRIIGASLSGLNLRGLDVRSILGACAGCDLEGANLRDADAHGVQLNGLNLASADLRGANLRGAVIIGANLKSVNFAGADLRDASLTDCSLEGANFRTADTRGTRIIGSPNPENVR